MQFLREELRLLMHLTLVWFEYCALHGRSLSCMEKAILKSYGIASVGDIVASSEFLEEPEGRRGRSSTSYRIQLA